MAEPLHGWMELDVTSTSVDSFWAGLCLAGRGDHGLLQAAALGTGKSTTVSADSALTVTQCLKLFSSFSRPGYLWWQPRTEEDEEKGYTKQTVVDAGQLSPTNSLDF